MTPRSWSKLTLSAKNATVEIRNLLVSLAKKEAESVASVLVTLLISSCLVSIPGYMLVGYGKEKVELRKEITESYVSMMTLKRIAGQVRDMANVYHSGWFSNDRETQRFTEIIDRIPIDLRTSKLDVHFVKDSLLWCEEAITQFSQERGKIKGYGFQDEVHKSLQTQLVAAYDGRINIVKEISEIISGWQSHTYDERMQRLGKVQKEIGESIGTIKAPYSAVDQHIAQLKARYEETSLKYLYLKEKLAGLHTRKTLAVLAVSLGLLFLVILIIGVILRGRGVNP